MGPNIRDGNYNIFLPLPPSIEVPVSLHDLKIMYIITQKSKKL